MAGNPYVRPIAGVRDMDELAVTVGVDYDTVVVCGVHRLNRAQCEEFARVFVAACWEASDNARLMAEEASE